MYVIVSIFSKKKLAFHIRYCWPIEKNGRTYSSITSTIPLSSIQKAIPYFERYSLVSNSFYPIVSQITKDIQELGDRIVSSEMVEDQYYPDFLLSNNFLAHNVVNKLETQMENFLAIPGTYFSSKTHQVTFHVIRLKLLLHLKKENLSKINQHKISASKFESQLIGSEVRNEYASLWKKSNIFLAVNDGVEYYMLLSSSHELLLVLAV